MSRKTLSELMESRRLDLVMTWEEIAEATSITTETLRQIRSGTQRPRPLTIRRLESGFRWQPGSLAAFLAGDIGAPTPAPGSPGAEPSNVPPRLRRVLEELIADPDADEQLKAAARARLQGHLPGDDSAERSVG